MITGASHGVGGEVARAYAARGVLLALTGRNAEHLETWVGACRAAVAQVRSTVLDVVDTAALTSWIDDIDRESPLDLVIAKAGITHGLGGDAQGETLAGAQRVMSINLGGVCNALHPVIQPLRRRRHGQLALMSSLAAPGGAPYSPAYCVSKAALGAYGEALRAWLGPARGSK